MDRACPCGVKRSEKLEVVTRCKILYNEYESRLCRNAFLQSSGESGWGRKYYIIKMGRGKIMKRIGLLTSGGDCQALNATMRGVVKGLSSNLEELEVYGFDDGYKGLIYGNYRMLSSKDFSGILTRGGTILGTSRQPFKLMRVPDEKGLDKVEAMKQTYYKLRLDCLVILGGNGTQKTANLLREEGLHIIHLPKTIDNDIWGTDMTFGFRVQ